MKTHAAMTEAQKQLWRAAGELYGLLEAELAGGDLMMRWDGQPPSIVYEWRYRFGDNIRAASWRIAPDEFACHRRLDVLAENIVWSWRRGHDENNDNRP